MDLETVVLLIVFSMFGVQTLAAGIGWVFRQWRDFEELREDLFENEETK